MTRDIKVVRTNLYLRQAKKLMRQAERDAAEQAVLASPDLWPIIPGTGGARKARIPLEGRGKRGGARMIYYWRNQAGVIYFMLVYAKATKENLNANEKKELTAFIKALGA